MKINQLTAKPQLISVKLDDKDITEKYGEAIEFWTWDRQPLDVFMKLASATEGNSSNIIGIVKDLILDEHGKPVIRDDNMLPSDVLMQSIGKIVSILGK